MKILVISQYYWPENYRITDIAESLVASGNDVTVLTGLPNYPNGEIFEGYRHGENRVQEHNGVKIIRAKLFPRKKDSFWRFLNYWSYQHYAIKKIKELDDDFDCVFVYSGSPVMLAKPGIKYARKYHKPLLMYEMDLWPESLLAGGISNKSLIYKHYKKVSAKIYSQFDKILVSTKEHIQYIKNLPNCDHLNIEYLPQYADTIFEESNFGNEDNGVIDLMFAGNIGKAQSVDTIIRTAALLKDDSKYIFHIVGSGSELDNIKKLATDLKTENVVFYGLKPLNEMPKIYRVADAMLVTLEDKPYANMTIPGKIQSYMATGKPIIGAINGSCANLIKNNNIGYLCPSGDYKALAKLIRNLNPRELQAIGKYSKDVYFNNYKKAVFIDKLIAELNSLKESYITVFADRLITEKFDLPNVEKKEFNDFKAKNMRKVLIIGKNSYIGKKFIAQCFKDFQIDEFDSMKPLTIDAFKGYDTVIHLAGIAHVSNRKSKKMRDLYMKVNRDLAIESCELAKKAGVKQFIFMSSMIIYGKDKRIGKTFEISKDTKPNPVNPYGQSKLEADQFIQSQNSESFKTLVIRSPMVYGTGCKGNYVRLLNIAKKLPVVPRIHNKRSVIEIRKLCDFFKYSIKQESFGIAYPQDDKYMDTTSVMVNYRKSIGKRTYQSVLLGLLVRFLSLFINLFRKMYSSKIYI